MERTAQQRRLCSINRSLGVTGDAWKILLLREAFYGVTRFDGFQGNLGISTKVLASRLRDLVEAGVLERRLYQRQPDRYEYVLTPRGHDLFPVLVAIMQWGDAHLPPEPDARVRLEHVCGHEIAPRLACPACHAQLQASETRLVVGGER